MSTDLVRRGSLFQQILNAECQVAITTWVWVVCKAWGGISANLEVNKKKHVFMPSHFRAVSETSVSQNDGAIGIQGKKCGGG